jgi:hypothetical protein
MALETVSAKYQVKDENGDTVMVEGKAQMASCDVEYDFRDDLNSAIEFTTEEIVFSQYKAAAKVALQNVMRTKLKAGHTVDQIQTIVDAWTPGMVMDRTPVDPSQAVEAAWLTWTPEKKEAFLAKLGVEI